MIGTLVAHCGAIRVTREELQSISPPPPTRTWKPVSHFELVTALDDELTRRGLMVRAEAFAVQREGALLFGVVDFAARGEREFAAALGLRTANDKSFALQIAVGVRVIVCDNLAFSGDLIALKRRHTAGLELTRELGRAMDRYEAAMPLVEGNINRLKGTPVSEVEAKAWICDAFREGILPVRFFKAVTDRFLGSESTANDEPRNLWALQNVFTAEARQLPPGPAFEATTRLGRFFGLGSH